MKRKLHRSRRSVFGRRGMHPALKTLLWIVACVAVVALGYFGAMVISEGKLPEIEIQVGGNNSADVNKPDNTPDTDTNTDTEPGDTNTTKPSVDVVPTGDGIRAFYLPHSALLADDLESTLSAAHNAGFTAVVFDLKDAEGNLYYRFTNAQAKKVNSYTADALSADRLSSLFDLMKESGLQPIPRLYAFCDTLAATVLTDARIGLDSNHAWAWYDGDPNDGGKKWLNPYAPAAQDYISALVGELKAKGASAILLDGVQFPSQLSSAYLGEEAATVEKNTILTNFVARIRGELDAECPLLLGCTEKGALGTDTRIYGGNPLTFGADFASPLLSSKIQDSVEKMILRTQVLEEKPTLAPILSVSATASEVNSAINACVKGGAKDFILYSADGVYDFGAYDLP